MKRLAALCILVAALGFFHVPLAAFDAFGDHLLLAEELFAAGEFDRARQAYLRHQKDHPHSQFAALRLAEIDLRLGRSGPARQRLAEVLAVSHDNVTAKLLLARVHLARGESDTAREVLARTLAVAPDDARVHLALARAALAEAKRPEAAAHLQDAADCGTVDADLRVETARLFSELGLPVNARLELERALALSPRHHEALAELGRMRLRAGEAEASLAYWLKALEFAPSDQGLRREVVRALDLAARSALERGAAGSARALWQRALELAPLDPSARYHLRKTERASNNRHGVSEAVKP